MGLCVSTQRAFDDRILTVSSVERPHLDSRTCIETYCHAADQCTHQSVLDDSTIEMAPIYTALSSKVFYSVD